MTYKTLNELDSVIDRINTHPEYNIALRNEITGVLRDESDRHSFAMEIDEIFDNGDVTKGKEMNIKNNIRAAYNHLCNVGLNLGGLSTIGHILEPDKNKAKYRDKEVQIGKVPPARPESILPSMKNLIDDLSEIPLHPVIRASHAHIELARIHPYDDGNGRAARLIQSFCLQQRGYPPATILQSEKELYFDLLQNTLLQRYNNESSIRDISDIELMFHKFIASKVLSSANELETQLRKRRMYHVLLTKVKNPELMYTTAQMIRRFKGWRGDQGVSVSINKDIKEHKSVALDIIGDISLRELDQILDKASSKWKYKYELTSKV